MDHVNMAPLPSLMDDFGLGPTPTNIDAELHVCHTPHSLPPPCSTVVADPAARLRAVDAAPLRTQLRYTKHAPAADRSARA
jgi:hypothetical protein